MALVCKPVNGEYSTCVYGHKCCDNFNGDHRTKRRTLKRRDKQNWKRKVRRGED